MNKKIFILLILSLFTVFYLPGQTIYAEGGYEVTSVPYCRENKVIKIDARIPVVMGLENRVLQDRLNSQFLKEIIDFTLKINDEARDFLKMIRENDYPLRQFSAYTDYKVTCKEKILSLTITYYQYTGGAHGLTFRISYNIDTVTGETLSLNDFFTRINIDREIVNKRIKEKIKKEPGNYYSDDVFKSVKDNQEFFIENNQLVIYFQQYEIAPYAAGLPEFIIPFSYK